MKFFKLVILFILLIPFSKTFGQTNVEQSIIDIIQGVETLQSFRILNSMRVEMENSVMNLKQNSTPQNQEKLIQLANRYGTFRGNYNEALNEIQKEILVNLTKKNHREVQNRIQQISQDLNNSYRLYLKEYEQMNKGKGLPIALIFQVGAELYNLISQSIKNKKIERQSLHSTYQLVAPRLFKRYYLKSWGEIWPDFNSLSKLEPPKAKEDFSPLLATANKADIKISFKQNQGSSHFMEVPLVNNNTSEGKNLWTTAYKYIPGNVFKISIETEGFVYFYAFDYDQNEPVLLHPKPIQEAKNTIPISQNPANFEYTQSEAGLTMPLFQIDDKGDAEYWTIVVSKSVINNPARFPKKYTVADSKNTIVLANPENETHRVRDESEIDLTDIVKIYNIKINKE